MSSKKSAKKDNHARFMTAWMKALDWVETCQVFPQGFGDRGDKSKVAPLPFKSWSTWSTTGQLLEILEKNYEFSEKFGFSGEGSPPPEILEILGGGDPPSDWIQNQLRHHFTEPKPNQNKSSATTTMPTMAHQLQLKTNQKKCKIDGWANQQKIDVKQIEGQPNVNKTKQTNSNQLNKT